MKNIYITMGGKGGVGKTIALLTLADYLRINNVAFAAIDCDTENSGKAAAFGSYVDAKLLNLRSVADCDEMLTISAEHETTLIDLPSNAAGDIIPWLDSVLSPEVLQSLDIQITFIGTLTSEAGSFASVLDWAKALQDRVRYGIVLNHRVLERVQLQKEKVFIEYCTSKAGKHLREAFAPWEVELPALYGGSMLALARTKRLPSDAVLDPSIPILDRARIKKWAADIHSQWKEALSE